MLKTVVERVMSRYLASPPSFEKYTWDAGPPVLAYLMTQIYEDQNEISKPLNFCVESVCGHWITHRPEILNQYGLYGGSTASVFGLSMGALLSTTLAGFHQRLREVLIEKINNINWNKTALDWPDYDLVTGPAGSLLVLCEDASISIEEVSAIATHLSGMLLSPDMNAFRITACKNDDLRDWNFQSVNLGLAHGIGGPLAALTHYIRRFQEPSERSEEITEKTTLAISTAANWLINQAHIDDKGILTCTPKASNKNMRSSFPNRREAWCYGAPSIAWVLWDAGDAIGRTSIAEIGEDIFNRYEKAFDLDFHLDDDPIEKLAICHGAAGIMLIADAFALHAKSKAGERLASRLEKYLHDQLPEIEIITQENTSLLSGGMGILSALLVRKKADRRWLSALALR